MEPLWMACDDGTVVLHVWCCEDSQVDRIVAKKPCRHHILSDLNFVRILSWFDQAMGLVHSQNCKSRALPLSSTSDCSQTSWGSRADGDTNDNERMSPRARRSESVTLPPGNHPVLIRYKDDKDFFTVSEKQIDSDVDSGEFSESELDSAPDASYDYNESNYDNSTSYSVATRPHGR